jgi:acetyl-CoA carboxylase biotin carboxyl carrier protein
MKGGRKRERTPERAVRASGSKPRAKAGRKAKLGAPVVDDDQPNGSRGTGGGEHPTVAMARQLAAIVESHALTELVMDTPDLTLTLRRGEWSASGAPALMSAQPAPLSPAAGPALPARHEPPALPPEPSPAAAQDDHHLVTSPFVGTFYRSPSPDADPYVVEGQRIEKGQVLCIVEAMKLMNEIEADQGGVIAAVLVQNAQPVEYGQPLFKIAPR